MSDDQPKGIEDFIKEYDFTLENEDEDGFWFLESKIYIHGKEICIFIENNIPNLLEWRIGFCQHLQKCGEEDYSIITGLETYPTPSQFLEAYRKICTSHKDFLRKVKEKELCHMLLSEFKLVRKWAEELGKKE